MPLTFQRHDELLAQVDVRNLSAEETEKQAQRYVEKFRKHILATPTMMRFRQEMDTTGLFPRCSLPWHVFGLRGIAALVALDTANDPLPLKMPTTTTFEGEKASHVTACTLAIRIFKHATPYLWHAETQRVLQGMPLPRHVISRTIMPFPYLFFAFEEPYFSREDGGRVDWALFEDTQKGINVYAQFFVKKDGAFWIDVSGMHIAYGKQWPDDFENTDMFEATARPLRMLAFINSPYTETNTHRLPRPIRREAEKQAKKRGTAPAAEPLCYTVTLRRPKSEPEDEHESGEGRDWKHRWFVSGHFRNQYYPSDKSHKLIYVAPYLKGPDDKPILEKTYVVAR